MKKLFIALSIVILFIASCSSKKDNENISLLNSEVKKIGILQLVEHYALDQANKGFVDGLKEAGYEDGKNVIIDYQNAQGEQANCVTISQKFINDKVDLILAIATPAAQAVANLTKDIPILITAVTDPADSKLVADNKMPGGNVTGTSDLTPVKEQMELLKKLIPNAKNVGFLYSSSEQNSKFQIDIAKAKANELGLSYVDATVTTPNDLQQVVQSLVGKVDVIYVPTDNMVSAGMANVIGVTGPANIPVICGEAAMLNAGGLATYGIDYYELGKLTATQAVKILKGESNPADMPIEYMQNPVLEINTNAANKLGVTIPADL
ncbi:ABC transporter substrate-binding protein [Brachyspira hyodysenteriae]|nr:ABC transporter substrate-binding protein [Brachyspira hyodysenteriae]ANN64482.1 sugar ABC transporter substrate-binding protein [Brachyspira hyodysenteriae ATCC 27164]AUJ49114.1 sugar ABC transporter substrate-binding protein [Brachyspira hyodysenteriae]KLI18192.1 sugar ABC transporter substrate-binding protein [Brachyspira hyodysenteriae]KLI20424.1 sugar ABC transporter substrate-binding protein [Brachyspira hyodysenteriae]KLI22980.1 sugar ABC transporter substrate-binding protein [Brachy